MKTNLYKKNSKTTLVYLMAFAMVLFSVNVNAQCVITASATSVDESCAGACDGEVSVNVSGSACIATDTVLCQTVGGFPSSAPITAGYMFQAQSSFTISALMCAESNAAMPNQSLEIADFGTTSPAAIPGPGSPHTTLFSAIDVPYGWVSCNVNIVAGNYYAIMGSKCNVGGAGSNGTLYVPPQNMTFDGIPTMCTRMVLEPSLNAPLS